MKYIFFALILLWSFAATFLIRHPQIFHPKQIQSISPASSEETEVTQDGVTITNNRIENCSPQHDNDVALKVLNNLGNYFIAQKEITIKKDGNVYNFQLVNQNMEDSK